MKDKVILLRYPRRFWEVAEVYKNGKLLASINKFYEINEEWIYIYETVGGTGTGWSRGDLKKKIFIGDCEFEEQFKHERDITWKEYRSSETD